MQARGAGDGGGGGEAQARSGCVYIGACPPQPLDVAPECTRGEVCATRRKQVAAGRAAKRKLGQVCAGGADAGRAPVDRRGALLSRRSGAGGAGHREEVPAVAIAVAERVGSRRQRVQQVPAAGPDCAQPRPGAGRKEVAQSLVAPERVVLK